MPIARPAAPRTNGQALHLAVMLAVVTFMACRVDLSARVDDPFQEGEYLIYRPSLAPPPSAAPAILIHGGLDQAPASLAGLLCPANRQIGCVRAINLGFQVAAACLLVVVLALLAGLGAWRAWAASLPTLAAVAIFDAAETSPVAAQQSAPGIRDLPVLAALLLIAIMARRLDAGRPLARPLGRILPLLLGACAAAAPAWAYNRGIVAALIAGGALVAAALLTRSPRPVIMAAAGGALALALLALLFGPALLTGTATNILYWAHNGALWRIPPDKRLLEWAALPALAAAPLLLCGLVGPRLRRPGPLLLAGAVCAIGLLYLLQSIDRMDANHLRYVLWPSTLLLALGIVAMPVRTPAWRAATLAAAAAALVLTTLSARALCDRRATWDVGAGWAANLRALAHGLPDDRTLAGPTLTRVADRVRAEGGCTFAANNAGLVYLLSGQPPCTGLALGAYIAPDHDGAVVAELAAARPTLILMDAPNWWAKVDGHPLHDHAPALADWLDRTYPVETSIDGFILRSRPP